MLFCSVSVLLFSLLTCLGNLSSSAVPLSLTNFSYILRCGLLFVGANPLGKATELEYQAACLLYHLDKVVQCHLDTVAHQKLDLLGFIEDDKLRNTKDFLFRQVHAEKDAEHNNNVCSYFGLSSEEVGLSGVTRFILSTLVRGLFTCYQPFRMISLVQGLPTSFSQLPILAFIHYLFCAHRLLLLFSLLFFM